MAMTLTGLIDPIHDALVKVPRELVGAISAVNLDAQASTAALNQNVTSPVVGAASAIDSTPGATPNAASGSTVSTTNVTITKDKVVQFVWSGDEQRSIGNYMPTVRTNQFLQAFRTISNLIEADVVNAAALAASRAVGTAGTTPFATANDFSDFGNSVKLLNDNGASQLDRSLIIGTDAGTKIRSKQSSLVKVNESNDEQLLRNGIFALPIEGFTVRESGQIKTGQGQNGKTVGTGASYVLNGSHAAGLTTVTVKTGTGTILAGDVVTITSQGVAIQYVVATALSSTTFTIYAPGLVLAGSDSDTCTVDAASMKNLIVQRDAVVLAARTQYVPDDGDAADDRMIVTDPVSGLSFSIALYRQYRQNIIEVGAVWGTKVVQPEFVGLLLG